MKVLMLTSSYPIEGSNLGPFVQNIVKGLVKVGVEVGVMVFSTSKRYKEYKKDGARIYEYPYTRLFPPMLHKNRGLIPSVKSSLVAKIELAGYFFSTTRYLKRVAKNYDIVHAHWFLPSGLIACLAKDSIKKPVVTTAWGAEFHLSNNFLVRKALGYVNWKSDSVVAVSKYMKSRAQVYGLDVKDMKVIPNSVDVKQFSLKRKKSNKIIIATVRRLVPEKRIEDLINAVADLPDELKRKINLWIIGGGPEKERLTKLTHELNLSQVTKFWGMVEHKDIPKLLSKIDIYVNPSIQEGMATANLEAMASSCCVIATKGVGNDEVIIDGENGFLYEGKDSKALAEKLQVLIENKRLRKKFEKKAIERLKNSFLNNRIVDLYVKEYKRVISK